MAAWRFRRSKVLGPLRLTATKRGLVLSVGGAFGRVSVNTRGEVKQTTRVPGAGLYETHTVAKLGHPHTEHACTHPHPVALPPPKPLPAWYPDPTDPRAWRWWDGTQWTQHTAPR